MCGWLSNDERRQRFRYACPCASQGTLKNATDSFIITIANVGSVLILEAKSLLDAHQIAARKRMSSTPIDNTATAQTKEGHSMRV